MADVSRQEKLASAKKKLKQFQQRKTPQSSPAPRPSPNHSLEKASHDISVGSPFQAPFQKQNQPQQSPVPTPKITQITLTPQKQTGNLNVNGNHKDFTTPTNTATRSSPNLVENDGNVIKQKQNTSDARETKKNIDERDFSPAEKIKQISNQLNGLITNDIPINADEQILKEIAALQKRNSELEDSMQSYKRSNQQLTNQLNEQRKHIIQYQEKLKKEKTEIAGKQSQELRAAKEQLEVHIQTIGILVSDKSELQESLRKSQKKLQTKENENEDINNRLQAVRQRVVELERNISNLHMTCEKYQQNNKELAVELEKANTKSHSVSKDKDDLFQQTSELQEMLASKVSENEKLEHQVKDLSGKLQKAELVTQQLTTDADSTESLQPLNAENEDLKSKLNQHTQLLEKLTAEKGELLERHHDQVENLESSLKEQRETIAACEHQKETLELEAVSSKELISKLEKQISEMVDKEAELQTSATHLAANEIEKLTNERTKVENELDIQVSENRRLSKLVLDQDERIQELESAVARLGEDAVDRVSLLEDMQSDKETISRAMQQNKAMKDQLEELEKGFVKITNANAELTTKLQKEQHLNSELAAKISEIGVELEEKKSELQQRESQAENLQNEVSEFKSQSAEMVIAMDTERHDLEATVKRLQNDLDIQIQQNDKLRHLEGQLELTDKLHTELQSAQDTINLLSIQNAQLKEELQNNLFKGQDEIDASHQDVSKASMIAMNQSSCDESGINYHDDEDDGIQLKRQLTSEGSYDEESNEDVMEHDSVDQPNDSITQEVLYSYRNAIGQLEADRDELYELREKEREEAAEEVQRVKDHMDMQLQQQLKQQLRQVQEHFQQQIHEKQLKIQTMQETIDGYKKQEDLIQADFNENGINYETLKIAFQQLQNRFKTLLDEKIVLADKVQEMEHINFQLSSETETIEEYINLYRTQRSVMKDKFQEQEAMITKLSNEHTRMQNKVSQLQELVMQTLDEKSKLEEEKLQLQELINKRLAIQTGDEKETEIPKFELTSDSMYEETVSFPPDEGTKTRSEQSHRTRTESESSNGKTQQIMQIFEQLHDTGEGYQKGWLSPAVRRREFTPCKHCGSRTVNL